MYLKIVSWNKSYYRSSNVMLDMSVSSRIGGVGGDSIECGFTTLSAEGLFWLFVNYHEIADGTPRQYYVKLSAREGKVFNMIAKTGFWRKRSYWDKVFKRDRKEVLKELEEMLPVWVLRSKLLVDKK